MYGGVQILARNTSEEMKKKKTVLIYNVCLSSFPAADSTGVESTGQIKDGRVRRTYPNGPVTGRVRANATDTRNNKHIICIVRGAVYDISRPRAFPRRVRFLDLGALLRLRAIAARAKRTIGMRRGRHFSHIT